MKSTVSEKGQVTIPKALRDRLGIRRGQVLDFNEEGGRLVAVKAGSRMFDAVATVTGIIDLGGSTNDAIEALRGAASLP